MGNVTLAIDEDGAVQDVNLPEDMEDESVAAELRECVVEALKNERFSCLAGETDVVVYPAVILE